MQRNREIYTYINVVVHNLKQGTSATAHNFDDLTERNLVEGLVNPAGVDSTLHRDATVEYNIDE